MLQLNQILEPVMSQVWVVVQDMDPLAMVLEQQIRVSWEMQQVEDRYESGNGKAPRRGGDMMKQHHEVVHCLCYFFPHMCFFMVP